ncbi:uncharacterized protein LOC107273668 isoform X2 [Cephus cinctus]|uniref:Uncharacterized protein LOC107273668 isoform X2 n=1 Tax=Cephus cinctus TaxID=211228 RepID=A0AAJ7CCP6_CEPCN|nr:uncharacterized protein LOC107273668 isoform X2 [Cephus cinctus]
MVHTASSVTNTSLNGVHTTRVASKQHQEFPAVVEAEIGREVAVCSEESTSLGRRGGRFSLFKWFKKGSRDRTIDKSDKKKKKSQKASDDDADEEEEDQRLSVPQDVQNVVSSTESVDTLCSTTTVHSFAFHTDTLKDYSGFSLDVLRQASEVGPFGAGASKVIEKDVEEIADSSYTLPSVLSRRKNITARYSLQPSSFNSCGNLEGSRKLYGSASSVESHHRQGNSSRRKRAHVKGKRRAPNPPGDKSRNLHVNERQCESSRSSSRRKRPAPRPPERTSSTRLSTDLVKGTTTGMDIVMDIDKDNQIISNDTLVLQGGVLLSKKDRVIGAEKPIEPSGTKVACTRSQTSSDTSSVSNAMPRPWYKRSVFENSRESGTSKRADLFRNLGTSDREVSSQGNVSEETVTHGHVNRTSFDATLSRLSFFHRSERQEEKKRESKRKSGLSILTNISELDKEAAAIVQEEQAKGRASMLLNSSRYMDADRAANEEVVQDIVTSAIESSPRRGTRALISKFNAIGNITKVTVNTSFFAKSGGGSRGQQTPKFDITRNNPFEHGGDKTGNVKLSSRNGIRQNVRLDKDISRYFFPQRTEPTDNKWSTSGDETASKLSASNKVPPGKGQLSQGNLLGSSSKLISSQVPVENNTSSSFGSKESVVSKKEILRAGKHEEKIEKEILTKSSSPRSRVLAEQTKNLIPQTKDNLESKQIPKDVTLLQKELSDIKDIDKIFSQKGPKLNEQPKLSTVKEEIDKEKITRFDPGPSTSSQVTKVLEILLEAEKVDKTKSSQNSERKSIERLNESESLDKLIKPKTTALNTIEDPITTDLKEMLKEMKHSLPKRPKPKKSTSNEPIAVSKQSSKAVTESDTNVTGSRSPYPVRSNRADFTHKIQVENGSAFNKDREFEKQKVSSAAQTSGNVRKINPGEAASKSGWKLEDVLYTTTGRSPAGTGLVKNTFQLIRPRDFAQIEATKTNKSKAGYKENTYANVIEESLYANALVPPTKSGTPDQGNVKTPETKETKDSEISGSRELRIKIDKVPVTVETEVSKRNTEARFMPEISPSVATGDSAQNMNTLAVNRLLRKLEAAIASGHHQQAAGLAKELARLKIHCSVVRQRTDKTSGTVDTINVNMYIEDKLAHQGPIPLQLPVATTVAQLKAKIFAEFEIPANVQRWIIGKNLADNDNSTLDELQAVDGSPIFLYLVAPELQNEEIIPADKPAVEKTSETIEVSKEPEEQPPEAPAPEVETEKIEEVPQEESTPEEIKQERYEELMSLENCDVIPNSEVIECPICFMTYGPREGVILRDCLHMFCRTCIANTILYCEEAEVKCPFRDTVYTCESTLQEREIKALVSPEIYQQHLAKSITQAENNAGNNAFHCKTPDCPGWCIYDDNVNNFLCPVCGVNNCLTCQVVHTGKNCREYQQELRLSKETDQESRRTAAMLEEMVDRGEALACPTCAVVLMKKWGCDWLRCSMCKTEICWVTRGPRWGPGGKGDTSGGCKCGENGVKCHPRCNYCH